MSVRSQAVPPPISVIRNFEPSSPKSPPSSLAEGFTAQLPLFPSLMGRFVCSSIGIICTSIAVCLKRIGGPALVSKPSWTEHHTWMIRDDEKAYIVSFSIIIPFPPGLAITLSVSGICQVSTSKTASRLISFACNLFGSETS